MQLEAADLIASTALLSVHLTLWQRYLLCAKISVGNEIKYWKLFCLLVLFLPQ